MYCEENATLLILSIVISMETKIVDVEVELSSKVERIKKPSKLI